MKRILPFLFAIIFIITTSPLAPAGAAEAAEEEIPTAYYYDGENDNEELVGIVHVATAGGKYSGLSFTSFSDALKAIRQKKVKMYDAPDKVIDLTNDSSKNSCGITDWSTEADAVYAVSLRGSTDNTYTIDGDLQIENSIHIDNGFSKPTTIEFTGKITIASGELTFTASKVDINKRNPVTVKFSQPVTVESGGRLEVRPSRVDRPENDTYELTAESGSLFNVEADASANIGQVNLVTTNTNTDPIINVSGELELGGRNANYDKQMYSGPNTVVAVQEGGSLTVNVAEFHTTGDNPAVTVAEGAAIEFITSTIVEGEFAPTDQITAEKAVAVELAAGATVKRDESVNVVVSAEQGGAGDNYVDNDGNIILAAGAKTDEDTLENAAVILPDGTIIQGSKDEAPTIDKDENGNTTVTVPSGGSVQKPGGAWVDMPAGGTADSAGNVTAVPVAIVTFENADVEPITVLPGTVITLPTPEDTRDAIFRYWTVAGDPIGTRYYGGEEFRADEDTTFVANWKDNSYIPIPPTQPTKPAEPDEPDEPDTPDVPDEPDTPDVPDKPDIPAPGYVDVPATAWYYDAVAYAADKGLMTGTESGAFAPELTTTRAMIWTILGRMSGASVSGGEPWYSLAQSWAVSSGVSDGSDPDSKITREQLAAMLYRYAGQPELLDSELAGLSGYADYNDVSSYAYRAMAWAVSRGIINGIGDSLAPQSLATRAQVAAMLMRFCEMDQ